MRAPAIHVVTVLRCNVSRTRRERIGGWLRRLASRIDGRVNLALAVDSCPPLGAIDRACAVRSGIEHMARGLQAMAVAEADELVLRRTRPELYAAEPAAPRRRA